MQVRDGAVELLGRAPAAGGDLAGADGGPLPGRRLGAAGVRDARPARRAQGRRRPAELRRDDRGAAADDDARGARRHARCGRATSSTRTRPTRPRTRRRRRSGSSTRPPTRAAAAPRTTGCGWSACVDGGTLSGTVRCLAGAVELPEPGEVAFDLGGVVGRARLELDGRPDGDGGRQRDGGARGARPRRGAAAQPALHAPARARRRRALHLAAARPRAATQVNTWPVLATEADDAVLGRGDHAPRPPAARAGEPRRPVRLDRDRGGAAAARDGALGRRARAGAPTRPCGR